MDYIHFDEQKKYLVDGNGNKYTGKRISGIVSASGERSSTQTWAQSSASIKLEEIAQEYSADAIEEIGMHTQDSMQEHDGAPWTATASGILYLKQPKK